MKTLALSVVLAVAMFFAVPLRAEEIFALTVTNKLLRFDSGAPGTIVSTVQVTGLQASENLVGIDFRPLTGQLVAVGSTSRVYRIDVTTGVATALSAGAFVPVLNGVRFGIDFNPTVDRIRCVSDTAQNLRLNPDTGTVQTTDTPLAYVSSFDPAFGQAPHVVSVAYTNSTQNSAPVSSTTLYAIDSAQDTLVTIGAINGAINPNNGAVFTVGKLGVDTTDFTGFDISGQTGVAYASLTPAGETASKLFTMNLSTGSAALVGLIGGGEIITDISASPPPNSFDLVALRTGTPGTLIRFDSRTPSVVSNAIPISGLPAGEFFLNIAFRPANGLLYGINNTNRIYTIDPITGAATVVSAAPLTPAPTSANLGFNFNPVPDRIRLVDDLRENFRINPDTGAIAVTDLNLAYAATDTNSAAVPSVVAAAYTNHIAGATSTTLYAIDQALDILVTIAPPNDGTLNTVGPLNADVGPTVPFDITPSGAAFIVIGNVLNTIDLQTGAATPLVNGTIGIGNVRSIAAVVAGTTPTFDLSAANFSVIEGSPGMITVTRTGIASGSASVDYAVTAGTAVAGTNFTPVSGTLTFLSGETSRTILVPTLNDNKLDLLRTVTVTLSNPVGSKLGAQTTATLTIFDLNDIDSDGFPNDVETAAASDPASALSTPFNGAPAGTPQALTVTKATIKLSFIKPVGSDSVSFGGTIPNTAAIPAGTKAIVDVGSVVGKPGVVQVVTLDAKGKSTPKGLTIGAPKNGVSKISASLSKGTFAALLTAAGLTNTNLTKVRLSLNFTLYFNNITYTSLVNMTYTAKLGKSGSAVKAKP